MLPYSTRVAVCSEKLAKKVTFHTLQRPSGSWHWRPQLLVLKFIICVLRMKMRAKKLMKTTATSRRTYDLMRYCKNKYGTQCKT